MNDSNLQKVTLLQAMKLKTFGFNWRVQHSYTVYLTESNHPEDGTSGPFGWKLGEVTMDSEHFTNNDPNTDYPNENYTQYAVPTVALALKWLRDVHRIFTWIRPYDDGQVMYVQAFCNKLLTTSGEYHAIESSENPSHSPTCFSYSNYDKAESAILDCALDSMITEK